MAYSKVILNGVTLMDVTQKTVEAEKMLTGYTALKNDGTSITGNYTPQTASLQAKTNIDPTTSSQTISPDVGYDGLSSVQINAMPSGSATTPATSITANPTITVSNGGLITASVSETQSVIPTVSAGYVSSGTAGTVTVAGSNTSQLTAKAAATYTPTTSNQTIAAGQYLTGAQTISGDANLLAENIKKDVSIFSVVGTYEGGGGGSSLYAINDIVSAPTESVFIGNTTLGTNRIVGCAEENDIVNIQVNNRKWVVSATRDDTHSSVPCTQPTQYIYRFTMPASSVTLDYFYDD